LVDDVVPSAFVVVFVRGLLTSANDDNPPTTTTIFRDRSIDRSSNDVDDGAHRRAA